MEISESLEYCLLAKLSKNFDECENHLEYELREQHLDKHFPKVLDFIAVGNLSDRPKALCTLVILFYELQGIGPWNTPKCKDYLKILNYHFELCHQVPLNNFLQKDIFLNKQEVFEGCLNSLHRKLTCENLKKYPSLIEVYCALVGDVQSCNVTINPMMVLPIALLLTEDHAPVNKIKGLKCCMSILQCLECEHFREGNYYEVIYCCLKKGIVEKNIDAVKLVHTCLLELLRCLPQDVKRHKIDNLYSSILEDLYAESNLYRKASLLDFSRDLIRLHKVNCVKKNKMFLTVICDNIDLCANDAVAEIVLLPTLSCLQEWVKYCWYVWSFKTDHTMLTVLFKILYICKEEEMLTKTMHLIATLITLCTKEEQEQIVRNLENASQTKSERFQQSISTIKNWL